MLQLEYMYYWTCYFSSATFLLLLFSNYVFALMYFVTFFPANFFLIITPIYQSLLQGSDMSGPMSTLYCVYLH